MNDEDKEKLINKYKEIAENQSLPLDEKCENYENIIFPIVMKVCARTIAMDLCSASKEEIKEVEDKIKIENRNNKIDSVVEGKDYIEKKLEEDEEYKKLMRKGVTPMSSPSGTLMYLDHNYDSCIEDKDDTKKKKKYKDKK